MWLKFLCVSMWFVQFTRRNELRLYGKLCPLTWSWYNENSYKTNCSAWQLITEQSAKLQQCKGQSQGKGCWEVRIYMIKNNVKCLTVGSRQRSVFTKQFLTTDNWQLTSDNWLLTPAYCLLITLIVSFTFWAKERACSILGWVIVICPILRKGRVCRLP